MLFKRIKENEKEYAKILVAGGDGTINQVVNFMIKYELDIPIGIYPVGTCNDFSVQFNIEKDVKKQTDILLGNNYTYTENKICGLYTQFCLQFLRHLPPYLQR